MRLRARRFRRAVEQRGSAMVMVLVAVTGLAAVSITAMWLSKNRLQQQGNQSAHVQALAAAHAGVERARWLFTQETMAQAMGGIGALNPPWFPPPPQPTGTVLTWPPPDVNWSPSPGTLMCRSKRYDPSKTTHFYSEYLWNAPPEKSTDSTTPGLGDPNPHVNERGRGRIMLDISIDPTANGGKGRPLCNIPLYTYKPGTTTKTCKDPSDDSITNLPKCAHYTVWVRPGNHDLAQGYRSAMNDRVVVMDVTGVAQDGVTTVRLVVGGDWAPGAVTVPAGRNAVANSGEYAQEGLNMGNTNASFSSSIKDKAGSPGTVSSQSLDMNI